MANLTEVSQWENVIRQLENGEAATGGADGLANIQAKQLANRTQWLKENYLPLAGGKVNDFFIDGRDNTVVGIRAGSEANVGKNPGLHLYSRDYSAQSNVAGGFLLRGANETAKKDLLGMPDGSLTWAGADLAGSAIVAKSLRETGYIKYASGLIIQWGRQNISSEQNITFPISFTSQYTYAFIHNTFGSSIQNYIKNQNADMRADGITLTIADGAYPHIEWFAIGY